MSKIRLFVLIFAILSCFEHQAGGFQCYQCKQSAKKDCLRKPAPNKACNKKYCTTVRVQSLIDRQVVDFQRSCEAKPTYLNATLVDGVSLTQTFYYACQSDLCNNGDGLVTIEIPPSKNIIVVPGIKSNANALISNTIISFNLFVLSLCLVYVPLLQSCI